MSQFERNMDVLNRHRLIYIRQPIEDIPTEVYDWGNYYDYGTHQHYALFRSRAKITTYKSLKWHLLVLWYLNPQLDQDKFEYIARHIVNKSNGFVTFTVPEQVFKNIVYDVSMYDLEYPPKNKLRKVVFKDGTGLDKKQKLSIVGQLIGRKSMDEERIYQCMLEIHDVGEKITIGKLAELLKCSSRTIHRNMSKELKQEKDLLNIENEKI